MPASRLPCDVSRQWWGAGVFLSGPGRRVAKAIGRRGRPLLAGVGAGWALVQTHYHLLLKTPERNPVAAGGVGWIWMA